MRLSDFDYDLPDDLVALRPARPRRAARLLVSRRDGLVDDRMERLARHLAPGDLLVFNDTRVIPARLFGLRRRGEAIARIEATLLDRLGPARWTALARPGKRLAVGDRIAFAAETAPTSALTADLEAKGARGEVTLAFDRAGPELDAAIAEIGAMPLPPYIAQRRAADAQDADDYQSMFARRPGAVAAPTASLHFDAELIAALDAGGVRRTEVTLHVGAGTFLPVEADDVTEHRMHAERGEVGAAAAAAVAETRAAGGRVVAVGTTALRILEAAADDAGVVRPFSGATDLFLYPGVPIRAVDGLVTNFHLPRSTLMMLVAALIGRERVMRAYAHAVAQRYRFYSYGDASLLWP